MNKFLVNKIVVLTIITLFIVMSSVSAVGNIESRELSKHNSSVSRETLNTEPDCIPFIVGNEGENGWFLDDVMIYFLFIPERVKTIYYRITTEQWFEYGYEPFYFRQEGSYPFEYYWEDYENNTIYPPTAEDIRIDKTQPTIQLNSQVKGWKKNKIEYTAKVNDGDKGSGIDRVQYYLDDELVATVEESPYEYLYTGGVEGLSVKAIVYDIAGYSNSDDTITKSVSLTTIYFGRILQRLSLISQIFIQLIKIISPFR